MKKKLNLYTEKDILKFYRFLPLYNSIFYKHVYFDTEGILDNNIKVINKILNEKNRSKKLEIIIDESCEFIDNYFKNKNICGFKECKCYVQRKKCNNLKNGCCRKCLYQSVTGCTSKNVACKLFFCSEVIKRYKIIEFDDIKILKCLSLRQRLLIKHDYFSKKEDVVKDLYFNSLLIGVLRMLLRCFINLYKVNRLNK